MLITQAERLFNSTIKSEATGRLYNLFLQKYLKMHHYQSPDQILAKQPQEIENEIVDCIITLKGKGMKRQAIRNYYNPVIKFCRANRVRLNSDIYNDHLPKRTKSKNTKYSHEQIQRLLNTADLRMRMVILLLSSTGVRIDALPSMTFANLEETDSGLYKIVVYQGEEEEYVTFCTPEAKQAVTEYREYREIYGEIITNKSPLIREQFDKRDTFSAQHPKHITKNLLTVTLTSLLEAEGIRTRVKLVDGQKAASNRSEVPLCNGFRRFFSSACVNSKLTPEKRWLLEGHNLKANDDSYVHVIETLEQEYLQAVPFLTINQENRLKEEVKQLIEKQDDITLLKLEHRQEMKKVKDDMEKQMSEMRMLAESQKEILQVLKHPDKLKKLASES